MSRNTRLVLDAAAVICLRSENEISFDSLLEDLRSLNYPIDLDQVHQSLQHLRRGGLVDVDWHNRMIKRTGSIKEYVLKQVAASPIWPLVFEDWVHINQAIRQKHGEVNPDFQDILAPKQR